MQLIPHRPPFLLLDEIVGFDRCAASLTAHRSVDPNDPVFAGHFPAKPIYPGALQLEIIAQAGACLLSQHGSDAPFPRVPSAPPSFVGTRVHHASFLHPVLPGDKMVIRVKLILDDTVLMTIGGQIWVDQLLHTFAILEAHPDGI